MPTPDEPPEGCSFDGYLTQTDFRASQAIWPVSFTGKCGSISGELVVIEQSPEPQEVRALLLEDWTDRRFRLIHVVCGDVVIRWHYHKEVP